MSVAIRCPHCKTAFPLEKPEEDRTFKCTRCGGMMKHRGRTAPPPRPPELTPPTLRERLAGLAGAWRELPGWALAAASAAVLAVLLGGAALGVGRPAEPHDRLFDALDGELDALAELVADVDDPGALTEATPRVREHVRNVVRLTRDPRPFGRPARSVGAAMLREYGDDLEARFAALRAAKSRAFEAPGVGADLSRLLRPLPQSTRDLAAAFEPPPG